MRVPSSGKVRARRMSAKTVAMVPRARVSAARCVLCPQVVAAPSVSRTWWVLVVGSRLSLRDWGLAVLVASSVLWLDEGRKFGLRLLRATSSWAEMQALSEALFVGSEAAEGMAAFAERRPPNWAQGA